MQTGPSAGMQDQRANVQQFIRSMVTPSISSRAASGSMRAGAPPSAAGKPDRASSPLLARLHEFQKAAVHREAIDDKAPEAGNQLFALRDKLDLGSASVMDRMTFDVVAMLFEFILEDKQIPDALRRHIGRLQIPMLKAAMLAPEMLQEERHPARQLLNRISSAAVAVDPATSDGQQLTAEIDRVTDGILSGFGSDMTVFSSSLGSFERFMKDHVRQDDREAARGIDAVELAEKLSILLTNTRTSLCDVLLPLSIDKRISDFIIHVWPHVLVHAAWRDMENNTVTEGPDSMFQRYRALLPELVWSIQEKPGPNERSALMRMLPALVKSLNNALQLIQLPEDERREILDQLMALHAQVLRGGQKDAAKKPVALEELRADFSRLTIHWDRVSWSLSEPPQPRADLIEEVLALRGIAAELHLGVNTVAASQADREFLAQTYLLGTRVEFRAEGSDAKPDAKPATLAWVSTHRSLYLFRLEPDQALAIYTSAALLEALSEGRMVPVEYAPVFERAVESLLFGAEKIGPA
jgi:hypothetical protein